MIGRKRIEDQEKVAILFEGERRVAHQRQYSFFIPTAYGDRDHGSQFETMRIKDMKQLDSH